MLNYNSKPQWPIQFCCNRELVGPAVCNMKFFLVNSILCSISADILGFKTKQILLCIRKISSYHAALYNASSIVCYHRSLENELCVFLSLTTLELVMLGNYCKAEKYYVQMESHPQLWDRQMVFGI